LSVRQYAYRATKAWKRFAATRLYKKAKLANPFQWRLFDLGYDKRIVEELTKELLRSL